MKWSMAFRAQSMRFTLGNADRCGVRKQPDKARAIHRPGPPLEWAEDSPRPVHLLVFRARGRVLIHGVQYGRKCIIPNGIFPEAVRRRD